MRQIKFPFFKQAESQWDFNIRSSKSTSLKITIFSKFDQKFIFEVVSIWLKYSKTALFKLTKSTFI